MLVKQVNVVLRSQIDDLARITKLLADNMLSIRALFVSNDTTTGVLRLIVSNPDLALKLLKDAGFTASKSNVVAISVPDETGTLNKVCELLKDNNVMLEYLYVFASKETNEAIVVVRSDNYDKVIEVCKASGVKLLSSTEVYKV